MTRRVARRTAVTSTLSRSQQRASPRQRRGAGRRFSAPPGSASARHLRQSTPATLTSIRETAPEAGVRRPARYRSAAGAGRFIGARSTRRCGPDHGMRCLASGSRSFRCRPATGGKAAADGAGSAGSLRPAARRRARGPRDRPGPARPARPHPCAQDRRSGRAGSGARRRGRRRAPADGDQRGGAPALRRG